MLITEEAFFFGCSHCASDRDSMTTTFLAAAVHPANISDAQL